MQGLSDMAKRWRQMFGAEEEARLQPLVASLANRCVGGHWVRRTTSVLHVHCAMHPVSGLLYRSPGPSSRITAAWLPATYSPCTPHKTACP